MAVNSPEFSENIKEPQIYETSADQTHKIYLDFLNEIYDGQRKYGNKFREAENEILALSEIQDERQSARIFWESLINFVAEKSDSASKSTREREKLLQFLANTDEALFSYCPSLFDRVDLINIIKLGSRSTRIPIVRGWFGARAVGSTAYALTFVDHGYFQQESKKLQNQSLPETLDTLNYLTTVGADAIANGRWAHPALERIHQLIDSIKTNNPSIFAQYAADLALERLRLEHERPSLGVLVYFGDLSRGRLPEFLQEKQAKEHVYLASKIKTDVIMGRADTFSFIARDAVAIFDQSTLPQFYALCHPEELKKTVRPIKLDFQKYQELRTDRRINPFGDTEAELPLLLQHLHRPLMREKIERDLNISLNKLPLRSQIHFLRFLADADPNIFQRLQQALAKNSDFADELLISFLACAEDKILGEKIINLSENLPADEAKTVFKKYAKIVETTENIRQSLKTNFWHSKDYSEETIQNIVQRLLQRGNDILIRYSAEHQGPLAKILDQIKTELLLFASTFKALREMGESLSLEDFRKIRIEIQNSEQISNKDKEEMARIASQNWQAYPRLHDPILKNFRQALQNKDSKFYLMRYSEDIVSFLRFDLVKQYENSKIEIK